MHKTIPYQHLVRIASTLLLLAIFGLGFIPSGQAANRLMVSTGPLNSQPVSDWYLPPTSGVAVYAAAEPTDPQSLVQYDGLYVVSLGGGPSVKLDARINSGGGNVAKLTPNGQSVVFLGTPQHLAANQPGSFGLWLAPVNGGNATKVLTFEANASITISEDYWALTPDGSMVVILYQVNNDSRLYSAPLNGTNVQGTRLNVGAIATGSIRNFRIGPNSATVAFVHGSGTPFHLYAAPVAGPGSATVKLTSNGHYDYRDLAGAEFASQGTRIVYADNPDIWSANVDGTDKILLAAGTPGGFGEAGGIVMNPTLDRILYGLGGQIYSVSVSGPAASSVQLTTDIQSVTYGRFSGDGQTALILGFYGIYSVPVTGPIGPPTPIAQGREITTHNQASRFIYLAEGTTAIWSGIAAGTPVDTRPLTPDLNFDVVQTDYLTPVGKDSPVRISPNGQYLAYRDNNGLFIVQLDGLLSGARRVTQQPPVGSGSSIISWQLTADSQYLVYAYNHNLYAVNLFPGCPANTGTPALVPTLAPGLTPRLWMPAVTRCH